MVADCDGRALKGLSCHLTSRTEEEKGMKEKEDQCEEEKGGSQGWDCDGIVLEGLSWGQLPLRDHSAVLAHCTWVMEKEGASTDEEGRKILGWNDPAIIYKLSLALIPCPCVKPLKVFDARTNATQSYPTI